MKKTAIALVALMMAMPVKAQGLGDLLGAVLGAVVGDVGNQGEEDESKVGIPQQNLSLWGIKPANYSGITPIGNGRYAVVSDKESSDGFYIWKITQDQQTGRVINVENEGYFSNKIGPTSDRDCEGIAYLPAGGKKTASGKTATSTNAAGSSAAHAAGKKSSSAHAAGTLFISGESDNRILEYDMEGQRTGRELRIPDQFRKSVGNMGLEALALGGQGTRARFWATTETTLPSDGPAAGPNAPGTANMLRIQSFKTNLAPHRQYAYKMDPGRTRDFGSPYVFGCPEICALPNGRLLILEREANIPKLYVGADVTCKLYLVNPKGAKKITQYTDIASIPESRFMRKELVASWTTRLSLSNVAWANYEGMCLGAKLSDGRQTLLLISDSQGGYGKGPVRLQDWIKVVVL